MISDKILENARKQPDKVAIIWRNERVSYGELERKIQFFAQNINESNRRFFINTESPIEAIAQLTACQITGNTGLLISDNLPTQDKTGLETKYGFTDFSSDKSISSAINTSDNYFLGVLTSGSSGSPKVIFKDNYCWEKAFPHQSDVFGINEHDTIFVLDALAYSANLNAALHALWLGATLTFGTLASANSWGKQFAEEQVTTAFLVPSHLKLLINQQLGNSVKSIVTAGEKLSVSNAQAILERFPTILLTEYYGTAELGHVSYHQNREIINNPLSVGKAFPEVKIDIREKQLYVKSPYVSPEFKNIETVGDLGVWENGNLVLLGRSGRMFNRRGLNIYAQEIEQKALLLPVVNEVYLLERIISSQKKLHLIFSVKPESPPQKNIAKALMSYLQALLPPAKCPNKAIEVNEIPKLLSGKVDEKALLKLVDSPKLDEEEKDFSEQFQS